MCSRRSQSKGRSLADEVGRIARCLGALFVCLSPALCAFAADVQAGGGLRLDLRATPSEVRVGEAMRLEAAVSPRGAEGVQLEAALILPSLQSHAVALSDAGEGADRAAGDGVWSGSFEPAEPGTYELNVLARGRVGGKDVVARQSLAFDVRHGDRIAVVRPAGRPITAEAYPGETVQLAVEPRFLSDRGAAIGAEVGPLRAAGGAAIAADLVNLSPDILRREEMPAAFVLQLDLPADQPPGVYEGKLYLRSEYDRCDAALQVEVPAPVVTVSPQALDLGRIVRGSEARAGLTLSLSGRGRQPVRVTLQPWLGPDGERGPGFYVEGLTRSFLLAGGAAETIGITVPTRDDTPTGFYRSTLLVETPLVRVRVPVEGRVVRPALSLRTVALILLAASALAALLLCLWEAYAFLRGQPSSVMRRCLAISALIHALALLLSAFILIQHASELREQRVAVRAVRMSGEGAPGDAMAGSAALSELARLAEQEHELDVARADALPEQQGKDSELPATPSDAPGITELEPPERHDEAEVAAAEQAGTLPEAPAEELQLAAESVALKQAEAALASDQAVTRALAQAEAAEDRTRSVAEVAADYQPEPSAGPEPALAEREALAGILQAEAEVAEPEVPEASVPETAEQAVAEKRQEQARQAAGAASLELEVAALREQPDVLPAAPESDWKPEAEGVADLERVERREEASIASGSAGSQAPEVRAEQVQFVQDAPAPKQAGEAPPAHELRAVGLAAARGTEGGVKAAAEAGIEWKPEERGGVVVALAARRDEASVARPGGNVGSSLEPDTRAPDVAEAAGVEKRANAGAQMVEEGSVRLEAAAVAGGAVKQAAPAEVSWKPEGPARTASMPAGGREGAVIARTASSAATPPDVRAEAPVVSSAAPAGKRVEERGEGQGGPRALTLAATAGAPGQRRVAGSASVRSAAPRGIGPERVRSGAPAQPQAAGTAAGLADVGVRTEEPEVAEKAAPGKAAAEPGTASAGRPVGLARAHAALSAGKQTAAAGEVAEVSGGALASKPQEVHGHAELRAAEPPVPGASVAAPIAALGDVSPAEVKEKAAGGAVRPAEGARQVGVALAAAGSGDAGKEVLRAAAAGAAPGRHVEPERERLAGRPETQTVGEGVGGPALAPETLPSAPAEEVRVQEKVQVAEAPAEGREVSLPSRREGAAEDDRPLGRAPVAAPAPAAERVLTDTAALLADRARTPGSAPLDAGAGGRGLPGLGHQVSGGKVVIGTARYGGDWDCDKTAMPNLAYQFERRVGLAVETEHRAVSLASDEMFDCAFLFLSGHRDFSFTDAELRQLRRYLNAGGALWINDSTHEGDPMFDRAAQREIARLLPGSNLEAIPMDAPVFTACYDLRGGYQGYRVPPGDKYREDHLRGVRAGNRWALIYTRNDYGDGLEIDPNTHPLMKSLTNLSPQEMQEGSIRMSMNLSFYFLGSARGADEVEKLKIAGLRRAVQSLPEAEELERALVAGKALAPLMASLNAEEPWRVMGEWSKDRTELSVEPTDGGKGERITVSMARGESGKNVIGRSGQGDLSGCRYLVLDLESAMSAGARVAVGLSTGEGWTYYESSPRYVRPGDNPSIVFDLVESQYKTASANWQYTAAIQDLGDVRAVYLLFYPISDGTVTVRSVQLAP